jgi:hypothetical protein
MTSITSSTHAASSHNSDGPARGTLKRSVGAIAAGFASVFVATTAVDIVLHATGVFPPMDAPPMSNALFGLALAYRVVFDVAGAALTARMAPHKPMLHAAILGGLGTLLCIAGAVAMWNAGPHWYPLVLAVTALPTTLLGARLARR